MRGARMVHATDDRREAVAVAASKMSLPGIFQVRVISYLGRAQEVCTAFKSQWDLKWRPLFSDEQPMCGPGPDYIPPTTETRKNMSPFNVIAGSLEPDPSANFSPPYWIPDRSVSAAALDPLAELIPPETFYPDGTSSAEGGYPPINPGFTAAQVQDISNACAVSMSSGQPEPLAVPFTYTGALTFPGLVPGDTITHMLAGGPNGCISNAELARACKTSPDLPQCEFASKPIPRWAYAVGAVGALALLWAVMK